MFRLGRAKSSERRDSGKRYGNVVVSVVCFTFFSAGSRLNRASGNFPQKKRGLFPMLVTKGVEALYHKAKGRPTLFARAPHFYFPVVLNFRLFGYRKS